MLCNECFFGTEYGRGDDLRVDKLERLVHHKIGPSSSLPD